VWVLVDKTGDRKIVSNTGNTREFMSLFAIAEPKYGSLDPVDLN